MFKKLVNEAVLTFTLRTETPLLINQGSGGKIRPGYDMSPVVSMRAGKDKVTGKEKETVYIPGSSIKGVFRTRYEQLLTALQARPCNVVDLKQRCSSDANSGDQKYQDSCPACRLFGNLSLGSRIQFADAYPVEEPTLGFRHGVGINRITGAAHQGAKFDYQMIEKGAFLFTITMQNFALYQLRLIVAVLQDIDAGLVTFGMGGTRGNGRLKLVGGVHLEYKMTSNVADRLTGYFESDRGGNIDPQSALFGIRWSTDDLDSIMAAIGISDKAALEAAISAENAELEAVNRV